MPELMSFETDAISRIEIAQGVYLPIHQAVKQDGLPYSQRHFGYKPLFMPTVSEQGSYQIKSKKSRRGSQWEVSITIDLDNVAIKSKVLEEIKRVKGEKSDINNLSTKTIYARPIYDLKFFNFFCDGEEFQLKPQINFFPQLDSVSCIEVVVLANDEEDANFIVENAQNIRIDYSYSFNKIKRDTNQVSFSFSDIRNTNIFKQLKGIAPNKFIERNDLRRFVALLCRQISVVKEIDRPEYDTSNEHVNAILSMIEREMQTIEKNFEAFTQEADYDENDIKSDVLSSYLEDNRDHHKNEFDVKVHLKEEAKLLGDIVGAGAEQKVETNIKNESDIWRKKEIKGAFYTAKNYCLLSDVLNVLSQENSFQYTVSYNTREIIDEKDSIFFSKFNYTNIMQNIQLKIEQLEQQMRYLVPIGTIASFAGENPNMDCWVLCDGRSLSKAEYPLLFDNIQYYWGGKGDKFRIPDLQGRFLRGVSNNNDEDPDKNSRKYNEKYKSNFVGSYQEDAIGKHDHEIRISNSFNQNYGTKSILTSSHSENTAIGSDRELVMSHGQNETRPKNAYVNFFIKTK